MAWESGTKAALAGVIVTLAVGLGWISLPSNPPVDPPQNEAIQNQ